MSARRRSSSRPDAATLVGHLAPIGQAWRLPLDALILVTVLFATFTFGAAEPWSQQVVAGLSVLVGLYVLAAAALRMPGCRPVGSWVYLPIAAFLLLVVLQTVPLPASVLALVAPGTHATRAELLSDLGGVEGSAAVSLLPAATWRQLWPLLPVIAVFLAALHAYRGEAGVRRLLGIVALCGFSAAVFVIYQLATDASGRFGGAVHEHRRAGPFLNYSHLSQYVNLGVGAAVGLFLVHATRLHKRYPRFNELWRQLGAREQAVMWGWAAVAVVGAVAVLVSMSRGGVIALLLAGGLAAALLAWRGRALRADGSTGAGVTSGGGRRCWWRGGWWWCSRRWRWGLMRSTSGWGR